jgi:hypothetical protein
MDFRHKLEGAQGESAGQNVVVARAALRPSRMHPSSCYQLSHVAGQKRDRAVGQRQEIQMEPGLERDRAGWAAAVSRRGEREQHDTTVEQTRVVMASRGETRAKWEVQGTGTVNETRHYTALTGSAGCSWREYGARTEGRNTLPLRPAPRPQSRAAATSYLADRTELRTRPPARGRPLARRVLCPVIGGLIVTEQYGEGATHRPADRPRRPPRARRMSC